MNYLRVAGTLIVLFIIASSCSTTKKMALPCPDPASRYHSKTSLNHPRNNKKLLATAKRESKRSYSLIKQASLSNKNQNEPISTLQGLNKQYNSPASIQPDGLTAADKTENKTNLYASADNSAVPVEEAYARPKINYLKYSGEMLSFVTEPVDTIPREITVVPQKTHGMAIAGFAAGIAGFLLMNVLLGVPQSLALFFSLLLLGAGGIVLSGVALRKIKENPAKYKGKGLAKAGVVIGIVFSILWLGASFVVLLMTNIS